MVPLNKGLQWVNVKKATQTDLGIIRDIQELFRHIQNAVEPWYRTMVYPEPRHIQNQKHIQSPGIFTTLIYSKPQYIQDVGIFKI